MSDKAIGSALLQAHGNFWHPIAYQSKKLKPTEVNWTIWEKEAFTLWDGINHFRYYLEGRKFVAEVDNTVVTTLMSLKNPKARIARWIFGLQDFDFEIKHRPGRMNRLADLLSRDCEVHVV